MTLVDKHGFVTTAQAICPVYRVVGESMQPNYTTGLEERALDLVDARGGKRRVWVADFKVCTDDEVAMLGEVGLLPATGTGCRPVPE